MRGTLGIVERVSCRRLLHRFCRFSCTDSTLHTHTEYLTTLEDEISSRDTIISQLRDEVGVMRDENSNLRGEVTMLKQKWDEMMEKMTAFTVPQPTTSTGLGVNTKLASTAAPIVVKQEEESWALDAEPSSAIVAPTVLTPVASTSTAPATARRTGTRGSNGITKPNLSKDVAPGLKRSTGSWTTASMGGGYMPVHTTYVSLFVVPLLFALFD